MADSVQLSHPGRIAIVGSGAIGCYYGARLAQQGHEVHFLMRGDYAHVREHGLQIHSPVGDFHLSQVSCHEHTSSIGPCDLVIVAMKTTSNAALPALLPPLLHDGTAILTLQNGLGNEEFLAEHFGAARVLGGLCFVCLNRVAPGVIHHLAQGKIALGEFVGQPQARTHAIAEALLASQIPCTVESSLMLARWRKLVWNIPFNGLSIVAGSLDTQQILAGEALTSLVRDLMREVIGAAEAQGYSLPVELEERMVTETKGMGPYRTSSLIDFAEGREVELEAIWGEPYRRAQQTGFEAPRLGMLYRLLDGLLTAKQREV